MLTELSEIYNYKVETNALLEYINFKNENPDFLILFQIGSFYETFFEDAKIFSQITGAQYTSRTFKNGIEIAEAGVSLPFVNSFIKKLLQENIKLCICSELKDENGKVFREITRKFTKGTIVEDEFLESSENNFLMAIKFDNEYEIAYADVSTGQIYKTKCNQKEYRTELDKISPSELLIPENQTKIFKNILSKYNVTVIDDKYSELSCENIIDKYCKTTQKDFKTKLNKIIEYTPTSYMALDEITRKNLELTRTNYMMKKRGSILWFLNYTKTPMGIRLLKKFLNEPLLSVEKIKERLDAIEELLNTPQLIETAQNILSRFSDLTRNCSKLSNTTISPKEMTTLAKNAFLLNEIKILIEHLKSKFFKINNEKLNKVLKLANTINLALKKEPSQEIKFGGIINEGYDSNLDFLNSELNKLYKKIEKYKISQQKKLNIEELNITSSPSIGYFIELPSRYLSIVPNEYMKKTSTSKILRYTTNELEAIEDEINALKFKINECEYQLFKNLRIIASDFTQIIRDLANDIALIDVILSFAKCAQVNNLSRPSFNSKTLIITEGYHPSLLKLNNYLVKNDTELNEGDMIILTGANMSGKSTYLKHNALICILAQIGSFVPAKCANIVISDRIIFRQNSNDDIVNNNSSFMVEMNDLKYILDNISNNSLILLDEPAKSTNAKESGAIARACCEYILNHFKTRAIIATHNFELTKIEAKYDNAKNYVIGLNSNDGIIKDRKIRKGVASQSMAINTAKLAQLPDEIIKLAQEYMK